MTRHRSWAMFTGWMDADSLSGLCALGPSLSPQIPLVELWEDRTWIIIPILQMRRCGLERENGGDQKLTCGALSPTSLSTPPQTAGAEGAAQMHRPPGLLPRPSLSRAEGGSVLLTSSLLFCKNILIKNGVGFDFYGEVCKRDIYLF